MSLENIVLIKTCQVTRLVADKERISGQSRS